jgi:hypothetical protein
MLPNSTLIVVHTLSQTLEVLRAALLHLPYFLMACSKQMTPTLSQTSSLGSCAVVSQTSTTSGRGHSCFSPAIFIRWSAFFLRLDTLSSSSSPSSSESAFGPAAFSDNSGVSHTNRICLILLT